MWMLAAALSWAGDPADPRIEPTGPAAVRLGWDVAHLAPAVPESPAIGPDRLAVGPGVVAWSDPVAGTAVVARDGAIAATIPASRLDDLAFAGGDLLILEGRSLRRVDLRGRVLSSMKLPDLVPNDAALDVRGDLVLGIDVFGNGHVIARIDQGLVPEDGRLVPARPMRKVDGGFLVDGRRIAADGKVAGRLVGDWVVVEKIHEVGGRIRVEREAVSIADGRAVALPGRGLYAPTRPIAAGADGSLWVMDPTADGLVIRRVSP